MSSSDLLQMVVDLGTTTLAAALVAGPGRTVLASAATRNPQRDEGLDVVSRLAVAATSDGLARLKAGVNRELEALARQLCATADVLPDALSRIVVAGNTVMQHLLLGEPVDTLSRPPFRPRNPAARFVASGSLGWQLDRPLYLFPQPGGFVGGDLVAFLYGQGCATPQSPVPGPSLYLDLGTNAEIALQSAGRLLATAAAAGPTFEAGNLACGMLALPGAITGVTLADDRPQLRVLGGGPPLGLCGSGAISAVAALRRAGIITASGQLLPAAAIPSNLANYRLGGGKDGAFLLYRDARRTITLSQEDIRQVQLALAAVRAGIEVLLCRAGLAAADLGEVVITGAFGAALDPMDLATIGLLPPECAGRSRFVSDGVLFGLNRAVTIPSGLDTCDQLAGRLQVIPLSGTPLFEELFLAHLQLPD